MLRVRLDGKRSSPAAALGGQRTGLAAGVGGALQKSGRRAIGRLDQVGVEARGAFEAGVRRGIYGLSAGMVERAGGDHLGDRDALQIAEGPRFAIGGRVDEALNREAEASGAVAAWALAEKPCMVGAMPARNCFRLAEMPRMMSG